MAGGEFFVVEVVGVGVVVLEVRCAWLVIKPAHCQLVPKRGSGPPEPSSGSRGRAAAVGTKYDETRNRRKYWKKEVT